MNGNLRTALVMALVIAGSSHAAAARPEDAIGLWSTPVKHGVVEIAACGTGICGRLVESDAIRANADARDTKNSEPAQRHRPLKGLAMLSGFTREPGGWNGGTIYNPDDGHTYHATITLSGSATLHLKGCVIWPLCKSQTWQRLR
jgi:uncharacterized protein (DUF2147 family)